MSSVWIQRFALLKNPVKCKSIVAECVLLWNFIISNYNVQNNLLFLWHYILNSVLLQLAALLGFLFAKHLGKKIYQLVSDMEGLSELYERPCKT